MALLRNLTVKKVALVPEGSNPKANITLFKEKDKPVKKTTFAEIQNTKLVRNALYKIYDMCYDMQTAISSSMYSDNAIGDVNASIDQFSEAMKEVLTGLESGDYAKVNISSEALIRKALAALTPLKLEEEVAKQVIKKKKTEDPEEEPFDRDSLDDNVREFIEELETKLAKSLKARATTPEEEGDEDGDEDKELEPVPEAIIKKMPKDMQAMVRKQNETIEKMLADIKVAKETAETARNEAAVEKAKRELVEFTKEAEKEFGNLPGRADEKGKLLQILKSKLTKEECESVVKLLKAGNAGVTMAMEEVGSDRSEGEKTAKDELEEKATALAAAKNISFTKAFDEVCLSEKELYKQMRMDDKKNKRTR